MKESNKIRNKLKFYKSFWDAEIGCRWIGQITLLDILASSKCTSENIVWIPIVKFYRVKGISIFKKFWNFTIIYGLLVSNIMEESNKIRKKKKFYHLFRGAEGGCRWIGQITLLDILASSKCEIENIVWIPILKFDRVKRR